MTSDPYTQPITGSQPARAATSFLALTGGLAATLQVWLMVAVGASGRGRAAMLFAGTAVVVWSLSRRPRSAGDLERLLVAVAGSIALWIGVLELALLRTVPMVRGLLALLTLTVIHAAVLFTLLSSRPGGALGRLSRRGLAALAILLATLTLTETAVRAVSPVRSYELVPDDPSAGPCLLRGTDGRLEGVPGCSGRYVHRDFPGLHVEVNALGLRDGLDEVEPPEAGDASVLVLGDSFAYGMGVGLEETFQQLLQDRLDQSWPTQPQTTRGGDRVRVFGAGMPGAGTAHEHAVLRELAPLARPDIVILALFQGNDMQDNLAGLERREHPGRAQSPGPFSPWRFLASTIGVPFWRTSSSTLQLRRIDGRPTLVMQEAMQDDPPPRIETLESAMLEELAAIRATCREIGAELVVLLVPGRVQVDPESFAAFAARHPERRFSRRAFHDHLAADIEALGIPLADPLPRLEEAARRGDVAYHPEGHWNPRGHLIAAELLGEAVGPLLEASASPPEAGVGRESRPSGADPLL